MLTGRHPFSVEDAVTIINQESSKHCHRTLLFPYALTLSNRRECDKGKPGEIQGRKATRQPPGSTGHARRAAEQSKLGSVKCLYRYQPHPGRNGVLNSLAK